MFETDDGRRGRPDVPRVGDLDDKQREKLVKRRRLRRRVKALVAVGLAVAAGVFLSCAGRTPTPRPPGPPPDGDGGMDGGMDAGIFDAAAVDVEQHRDGMPVPDNLLE